MSLRHRSALSVNATTFKQPSHLGRKKIDRAVNWAVEALESRVLLTTLTSTTGDPQSLVFLNQQTVNQPFAPVYETVKLFGNITAEIIGSDAAQQSLTNIAGQLNGTNINGGFALNPGATAIGNLGNTISSIAVDPSTGIMYGVYLTTVELTFNTQNGPVQVANTNVNLVTIDKTTGATTNVAEISQQLLAADGIVVGPGNNQTISNIPAMTFINGMLALAVSVGGIEHLEFLTPSNPTNVSAAQGTFGGMAVSALAPINGNLWAASGKNVFQVNTANSDIITNQTAVNVNGAISGMAQNAAGKVFVTTNNGNSTTPTSELYWINPVATPADANVGTDAIDYGPLPATVITNNQIQLTGSLGTTPGDLAFDPTTGTLYGIDLGTNQLFSVDQTNRDRSQSVFQIYVSQSDATGQIFVSQSLVPPTEVAASTGAMTPYGAGITGGLNVIDAQTGETINVAAPAESGTAIIGAITIETAPNSGGNNDPVTSETITATPATPENPNPPTGSPFTGAPYTLGETINAGVVSAPGTMLLDVAISGAVMGDVNLGGSIDTFYAGWLITGDTGGEPAMNTVDDPSNFSVSGDIRNLLVTDSIGTNSDAAITAPVYVTGFDMRVGGTIGYVHTGDSLVGNVNDSQSPTAQSLPTNIQETENYGGSWSNGQLAGDTQFYNNTFATAQVVGAIPTTNDGLPSAAVINGVLQADPVNQDYVDYYAVSLLAGQTVTCQVQEVSATGVPITPTKAELDLGVFNPDGDQVYSDYSQQDMSQTQEHAFRFTADRPGIWRFAVASTGDVNFTPAGGSAVGDTPYLLTIQNVGDIAIGGIVAVNNILDNVATTTDPEASFGAAVGDIGALSAGNDILSTNPGNTVVVQNGSLRDINASSIGLTSATPDDPEVRIPNGNVGLVSSTGATGLLLFNLQGNTGPAIGGNYQIVSSVSDLDVDLIADGSIGVIRAAKMTLGPSIFHVNDNNSTTPGNIDLIDDLGDFGTLQAGGPHIITGPGGNVGYLRVGGTTYRDSTFGGGGGESTLYQAGESVTLTDDSGAQVVITPTGTPSVPPAGEGSSSDSSGSTVNPGLPQLTITAYGIEGSGGVAIENVTSTGGVTITGTGEESGQSVQIGVIDAQGLGQTINQILSSSNKVVQPSQPTAPGSTGGAVTSTTTTSPTYYTGPDTAGPVGRTLPLPLPPALDPNGSAVLNVILNGTARMDVFEVDGGLFSEIDDQTAGDIVNVNAQSIGNLTSAGQIGLSQNHTGAALNGANVAIADTFPFIDVHNAIIVGVAGGVAPGGQGPELPLTTTTVAGGVTTITTTTATVSNGTDTITTLAVSNGQTSTLAVVTSPAVSTTAELGIANITAANGIGNVDVIDGGSIGTINGSILAPVYATGSIYSTVLGSGGIGFSGTGLGSNAGLYAVGEIGTITNSVPCDIRGVIASTTGITGINLKNGSIIDASVQDVTDLSTTVNLPFQKNVTETNTPITNPVLDIGNIIVTGNGGIIGSSFVGDHIGHIDVYHGFGVLDCSIITLGTGTLSGVLADGYGFWRSVYTGSIVGSIVATGNGSNVSTQVYSSAVRLSEVDQFDPYTGFQPNLLTDLDITTGATAQNPQVAESDSGGTQTGILRDLYLYGNRSLGTVRAYKIYSTYPVTNPSTFNFANSIGSITTTSGDDGLSVITGRLGSFNPGGTIDHLTFQIAGPIKSLNINGSVTDNSIISASGINGNIGTLRVTGSMQGSITAHRRINTVSIGGNLTGVVTAAQINSLKIYGTINGGNLDVLGNVNTFTAYSDLGVPGETITFHGSVKTIKIAGNLNSSLIVQGKVNTLFVGQSVLTGSTTTIANTLNLLQVDGDVQAGATITAALIKKQKIYGLIEGVVS